MLIMLIIHSLFNIMISMIRIINIGDKKKAYNDIQQFKNKNYDSVDVEFNNVHMTSINKLVGFKLFSKTSLYARSSTLWEAMQPVGKVGRHHYHGFESHEIIDALGLVLEPELIYESYLGRYVIIVYMEQKEQYIMIIIEKNAGLENDRNANVNKLVTLYPKGNFNKIIKNLPKDKILYNKK